MKKSKVLFAALVFACAASALFAGPLGAGITAGGALSFVGTDLPSDGSPRYGASAGIYGTYPLSAAEGGFSLSLRPEVLFTMKGYRDANDNKIDINTIEAPILAKAAVPMNLPVVPYLLLGAAPGFSIDTTVTNEDGDDITDAYLLDFNSVFLGAVFGAGVETEMGLDIDVRFNMGLLNIIDSDDNYMKNRTIAVMASYQLF